jgi:hypothetical protein
MKRRLSSLQTVLMKIVYPVMWIPIFAFITFTMPFGAPEGRDFPPKWLFMVGWVASAVFVYWSCVRLKAVSVDDQFLSVSNYLKEVSIPLCDNCSQHATSEGALPQMPEGDSLANYFSNKRIRSDH